MQIFPIVGVFDAAHLSTIHHQPTHHNTADVNSLRHLWHCFKSTFSLKEYLKRVCSISTHAGPMCSGGIRHHKSSLMYLIVSKCLYKASGREQTDKKTKSSQDPSVIEYARGGIGFDAAITSLQI